MEAHIKDKLVKALKENKLSGVCVCYNKDMKIKCFQLSYVFVNGVDTITMKINNINYNNIKKSTFDIYLKDKLVLKNISIENMNDTLNKYKVITIKDNEYTVDKKLLRRGDIR